MTTRSGFLVLAAVVAMLAIDFDDEDTCHEGNVDLVHLKNVYDQARQK